MKIGVSLTDILATACYSIVLLMDNSCAITDGQHGIGPRVHLLAPGDNHL